MKKILVFLFAVSCFSGVYAQTLFTYGNNTVTKDEFLRAYNKNKTTVTDKSKALKEYLDLYIKFKLKVKAAREMHLDTLASLTADLQNFRTQIEEGYLSDDKEVDKLVQEAFNHSQKDIHINHLFIPVARESDSLKIRDVAQSAYMSAMNQKSFSQITDELNKSPIQAEWADAGFITAFTLPYAYENIIYQLQPGQVSKPLRTKNGYQLFKNVEERKAAGKLKVAQILISVPPASSDSDRMRACKMSDSIYKALQNGADFSEMARNYSNDKMTFITGGELPEFGVGKFTPFFESKAFALKKDGDITPPFETEFGFHILRRLSHSPIPADKNEAYIYSLKQAVQQDPRMSIAKDKFLKDVLIKTHYKKNSNLNLNDLWRMTDSFLVSGKKNAMGSVNENTFVHSFDNGAVKVSDWLDFVNDYKTSSGLYKGESDQQLMDKYISVSAFGNYRKRLEKFNPDFRYQLEEFKEGNMLFEVMERNVWSRAANDSNELKSYFERAKNKYLWGESADAILVSAATAKLAADAVQQIRNGKNWRQVLEDGNTQLQADSGRYELKQLPVSDKIKVSEGMITDPLLNTADGTASFVKIIRIYPPNQPRNFEEARGLVINDYQNLVEERWIAELKKKYPVKINQPVFQSLLH
ncbi:MAG: peptidylprolyl isomerase [Ginsengibacter sp.]